MTHPSERLRRLLDSGHDEVAEQRMWTRIARTFDDSHAARRRVGASRWGAALAIVALFFATSALGMTAWMAWRHQADAAPSPSGNSAPRKTPARRPSAHGPGHETEVATPAVPPAAAEPSAPRVQTRDPDAPRRVSRVPQASSSALDVRPSPPVHTSAAELLRIADAARVSGNVPLAVGALERVLVEHPGSREASVAAITLGRIELEQLSNPNAAARAFERGLSLGPPNDLVEGTFVRLVRSYLRAGRMEDAREAAARYLARFPEGRYVAELRLAGVVE